MNDTSRRALLQSAAALGGASVLGVPLAALAQPARGGVVGSGTTHRPPPLNPAVHSGHATKV
ncbi:MAG: hypothetical protein O9345_16990, partial [Burkholderiaceae bacterium]|nr:hypothetical protein [Burkholderiaceae bacterium]